MKDEASIDFFIEKLKGLPIVAVACEKAHIARSTVYEWRATDPAFRKRMDDAFKEGVDFVNDMSEAELIALIRDGEFRAISYWLSRRNPKFRDRIELSGHIEQDHKLDEKQEKLILEALRRRTGKTKPEDGDGGPKQTN